MQSTEEVPDSPSAPSSRRPPPPQQRKKRPTPPRPDHFLSLRVSHSPRVIEAFNQVHSNLVAHSPHLQQALVEPITAHLTVGLFRLQDQASKDAAIEALQQGMKKLVESNLHGNLNLNFGGLSHFRNSVLFIDCLEDESLIRLKQVVSVLNEHFKATVPHLLAQQGDREFAPHVTVAKLSKMQQPWKQRGGRKKKNRNNRHNGGNASNADGTSELGSNSVDEKEDQQLDTMNTKYNALPSSTTSIVVEELGQREEDIGEAAAVPTSNHEAELLQNPETLNNSNHNNDSSQSKGRLIIPVGAYCDLVSAESLDVGLVEICDIELCAMAGRVPGQFYNSITRVSLTQSSGFVAVGGDNDAGQADMAID